MTTPSLGGLTPETTGALALEHATTAKARRVAERAFLADMRII
jgi:hypothetical protein